MTTANSESADEQREAEIRDDAADSPGGAWAFLLARLDQARAERDALLDCRPIRERDAALAEAKALREALEKAQAFIGDQYWPSEILVRRAAAIGNLCFKALSRGGGT